MLAFIRKVNNSLRQNGINDIGLVCKINGHNIEIFIKEISITKKL